MTFEEAAEILDEFANELPPEIYKNLNGGINLIPGEKKHDKKELEELYILGDYNVDRFLGRYINIYFGSFMNIYEYSPLDYQKEKLKGVLHHELTHHLESLAGERDLEIQDAVYLKKFLST